MSTHPLSCSVFNCYHPYLEFSKTDQLVIHKYGEENHTTSKSAWASSAPTWKASEGKDSEVAHLALKKRKMTW